MASPSQDVGGYARADSSSLASALVMGAAGLVWSAHPNCSRDSIDTALCDTGVKVSRDPLCDIWYPCADPR